MTNSFVTLILLLIRVNNLFCGFFSITFFLPVLEREREISVYSPSYVTIVTWLLRTYSWHTEFNTCINYLDNFGTKRERKEMKNWKKWIKTEFPSKISHQIKMLTNRGDDLQFSYNLVFFVELISKFINRHYFFWRIYSFRKINRIFEQSHD